MIIAHTFKYIYQKNVCLNCITKLDLSTTFHYSIANFDILENKLNLRDSLWRLSQKYYRIYGICSYVTKT
jgi:hypothetical protein